MFGALHLEIVGRQLHRCSLTTTAQRVANGALQIEVERIAVFVLLGLVGAFVTLTETMLLMLAGLVLGQTREDVAQRLGTDLPHAARGDLQLAVALTNEPLALHLLHQLGQLVHGPRHLVAQQVAHPIHVGFGQLLR